MNTHHPSRKFSARLAMLTAALLVTLGAAAQILAAPDHRAAVATQSRALMDAVARGDAQAAAALFTANATLIVPGAEGVIAGRDAIAEFWNAGFRNGVKGLRLTATDLEGEDTLQIETGTYQALGADGSDLGQGHYLFVWKKDRGIWRIHRDIASAKPAKAAIGAAPAADRVGFPRDYGSSLKLLGFSSQAQEPSVMTAYGNQLATSVVERADRIQYPYGTVIAMEFAHGVRDGEGQLLSAAGGVLHKGEVARIDVMRREPGYGAVYGESRAGEWEFASYRPDGSILIAPENAGACAACHLKQAGPERDFVFRRPGIAARP
jgi:uncharacterized protein (TIGR02246 family)